MSGPVHHLTVVSENGNTQEEHSVHVPAASGVETAEYLSQMLRGLQDLAQQAGLDTLVSILEIAGREARLRARGE